MMGTARRFYTDVTVTETGTGFSVLLDGRSVKTPAGTVLELPGRALAEAVAEEWSVQETEIRPETMPLFKLVSTALDRIRWERQAIVDGIVAYAQTDLLCYRAEAPRDLAERQEAVWQPLLDWMNGAHGITLSVTAGVMPVSQPEDVEARLRRIFDRCNEFELAAISSLTAACGSVVLALALTAERIGPEEAFAAAQLDELYQAEQWGPDEEATARRERLRGEIQHAFRFLALAGGRTGGLSPAGKN